MRSVELKIVADLVHYRVVGQLQERSGPAVGGVLDICRIDKTTGRIVDMDQRRRAIAKHHDPFAGDVYPGLGTVSADATHHEIVKSNVRRRNGNVAQGTDA